MHVYNYSTFYFIMSFLLSTSFIWNIFVKISLDIIYMITNIQTKILNTKR